MRWHRALLLSIVFAIHAPFALAAPQNGWWWNPAESGRGFFIEIVDGFAYIGAYVYAPNGRADWVVSQGTMASPTSYSGRLLTFRGGQTLVGDYKAPGAPTDVGAINVEFSDDRHATLTWPGGTVPIERLVFDGRVAEYPPKTGWWWNEQESGTGWSIEVQGGTMFVVGFMYDDAGEPVWYYSAGPLASATSYSGSLLRFANGQPIVGPYRAPGPPTPAGTISIEFTAPDSGEMTLSDGVGSTLKRARRGRITPTLPAPPIVPPGSWQGLFSDVLRVQSPFQDVTYRVTGNGIVWERQPPSLSLDDPDYAIGAGTVEVRVTGTATVPFGSCVYQGPATTMALPRNAGGMYVNPQFATYSGFIRLEVPFSVDQVCTGQLGGTYTLTADGVASLDIELSGHVIDGRMRGHPKTITLVGGATLTNTDFYYFVAVP